MANEAYQEIYQHRQKILDSMRNGDDRLFMSKVLDQLMLCAKYYEQRFTSFLDPYQGNLVVRRLGHFKDIGVESWGGYTEAERKTVCFFPGYMEKETLHFPIAVLKASSREMERLSHRDFLGSLLGLGIKREKIGDILIDADGCTIFCMEDIADYIAANLVKVGNTGISAEKVDIDSIVVPEKKYKLIQGTVASLRLDAVLGLCLNQSRSKVVEYIQAGRVNVNWEPAKSSSQLLNEGSVISVRGHGRMMLESVGGTTRKGRTGITIKRYI